MTPATKFYFVVTPIQVVSSEKEAKALVEQLAKRKKIGRPKGSPNKPKPVAPAIAKKK